MYTREQVLGMVAGRELDHLVEVYIMQTRIPPKGFHINPKHYSTDIAAAWEVVEKMHRDERHSLSLEWFPDEDEKEWCADFDELSMNAICLTGSAPEAICKAALLSLLKED